MVGGRTQLTQGHADHDVDRRLCQCVDRIEGDLARPRTDPVVSETACVVSAAALLPDSRIVTAGLKGRLLAWDPDDLDSEPDELGSDGAPVNALAVLPDGRLVSGGDDRRVVLWDLTSRSQIAQLHRPVSGLATGPPGPGRPSWSSPTKAPGSPYGQWRTPRTIEAPQPTGPPPVRPSGPPRPSSQ